MGGLIDYFRHATQGIDLLCSSDPDQHSNLSDSEEKNTATHQRRQQRRLSRRRRRLWRWPLRLHLRQKKPGRELRTEEQQSHATIRNLASTNETRSIVLDTSQSMHKLQEITRYLSGASGAGDGRLDLGRQLGCRRSCSGGSIAIGGRSHRRCDSLCRVPTKIEVCSIVRSEQEMQTLDMLPANRAERSGNTGPALASVKSVGQHLGCCICDCLSHGSSADAATARRSWQQTTSLYLAPVSACTQQADDQRLGSAESTSVIRHLPASTRCTVCGVSRAADLARRPSSVLRR